MSILTTRVTHFEVDDVDFSCAATAATIKSAEGSWRPLCKASAEREYTIEIVAGQDLTADSLWHIAFTQADQEVEVVLKPYGNADAPTADKPWVTTTATVVEPDGDLVGGSQDGSVTTRRTTTLVWPCTRPVLVTSTGGGGV